MLARTALVALGVAIATYVWLLSYGAGPAPAWLQTTFAIAWGAFLLMGIATALVRLRRRLSDGAPLLVATAEVLRRLLLGVCAPVALLALTLTAIVEGARGSGEQAGFAAMYVVWISFVAVPLIALGNCGLLFGPRRTMSRLFGRGVVAPFVYAVLALLAVQGPAPVSNFVVNLLQPLALLFGVVSADSPRAMLAAWAAIGALVALCTVAVVRQRRVP